MSNFAIVSICLSAVIIVLLLKLDSIRVVLKMKTSAVAPPAAAPATPAAPVVAPAPAGIRARLQAWWATARLWLTAHRIHLLVIVTFTLALITLAMYNVHYNNTFH